MSEIKLLAWDKMERKFHFPKLWDRTMPSNWHHFYILHQYTGLKDANGEEIYYGFTVCEINYPYAGEWIPLRAVFTFNTDEQRTELDVYGHPQFTSLWYDILKMKDIKVIGNIYEDKVLLAV